MDPTHTCPRVWCTSGHGSGKIETASERTGLARRVEVFSVMKASLSQGETQGPQRRLVLGNFRKAGERAGRRDRHKPRETGRINNGITIMRSKTKSIELFEATAGALRPSRLWQSLGEEARASGLSGEQEPRGRVVPDAVKFKSHPPTPENMY